MKFLLGKGANQAPKEEVNVEQIHSENLSDETEAEKKLLSDPEAEVNETPDETMKRNRGLLFEDKSKRELNAKHYVGNNGTNTVVFSGKAVHYVDERTKEMKNVDNSLSDNGGVLETKANSFKTRFRKHSADGEIFEVSKGKNKIRLISHDLAKKCDCQEENCNCEKSCCSGSEVLFKSVKGGADFQYIVDSDRIKENIIVNEKCDTYEYDFSINIENLEVGVSENDKILQLKDKESGEVKFYIPAPFMTDADGNSSDLVYYEIDEQSGDTLSLKVVADSEWINAEERKFPVTIDPQIVSQDSSIFTYEYQQLVEKPHSSGMIKQWEETEITGETAQILENTKFIIKIDKSKINFSKKSIVSVKLKISCEHGCHPHESSIKGCYINGVLNPIVESNFEEFDITSTFKNSLYHCVLTFTGVPNRFINFKLDSLNCPELIIEYIENENEPERKTFSLVGGVSGKLDLKTREFVALFSDINAGSTVLPLQISHMHKADSTDFHCGKNWRLNLHQKLIDKENGNYLYTDATGHVHTFNEIYYYVKGEERKIVDKSYVEIGQNGLLTCCDDDGKKYEVIRELRTNAGLRLITRLTGISNIRNIEQRYDEEKQLEEYIESCENSFQDLQIVKSSDGSIYREKLFKEGILNLGYTSKDYIILTKSEAVQFKTLLANIEAVKDEELKKCYIAQKNVIVDTVDAKKAQVKKLYKEYLNKKEEQKQLKRQIPTAYLIDDSGTILCFNSSGNLCGLVDNYENKISIEWGEIVADEDFKEVITAVYDGEHKTTLEYNHAGQLISITDPNGKRVEYSYSETEPYGELETVKFSDGKILYFIYDENGNIETLRSSDKTFAELSYSDGLEISKYSAVSAIADESKALSESQIKESFEQKYLISSTEATYGSGYIAVKTDSTTEYILLDEREKAFGGYTEKNGKIDNLSFFFHMDKGYKFVVTPKKIAHMVNPDAPIDGVISEYLKRELPVISSLPEMTEEYSDFAEAEWSVIELDEFNRPVSEKTNWRRTGTTNGDNDVYARFQTEYVYSAGSPNYPCISKITTVYTNLNGNESDSDAEHVITVEKYSYCEHGNLVKTERFVVDEENTKGVTVTERVCDDKGNIIKEFTYNSLDSSTKFYRESDYAQDGKVTAVIDETGENKTELIYTEGTNSVKTQVLPNGSKFSYGYDESGNVTAITQSTEEGEGNSTSIRYNLNCATRLTSGNDVVYYEYDKLRRKSKVTLNGFETTYAYVGGEYDDVKELSDIQNVIGGVTFAAEPAEKLTVTYGDFATEKLTDKRGNTVAVSIDGEVKVAYNYNKDGALTQSGDSTTGSVITCEYKDKSSAILNKVAVSAGTNPEKPVEQLTEKYTYNPYGAILTKKVFLGDESLNAFQTYSYEYCPDAAKTLRCVTLSNGLSCYPLTDLNGRNIGKELTVGSDKKYGEYVSYKKVGDHATNLPSAMYYGGNQNGKFVISDNLKYKYDSCGNIIEIRENGSLIVRYTYDSIGRLVREDNKKLKKSYFFSYDNCGNILTKKQTAYTFKPEEEIASFTTEQTYGYRGGKLILLNGGEIKYDKYGNPIIYRGVEPTWEYGKRLKKYGDTEFTYDGYGKRIKKDDIVFTYGANGNLIKQSNGLEFFYDSHGLSGFSYNGVNYIYRINAQGDITHILEATSGGVVAKYTYDAWGNHEVENLLSNIGDINPFRYRGYYYDTETKLYYLKTRYYDPEVGRFISQDNVKYLSPNSINGLNLYAYCGNNPVMGYDPSGNFDWKKVGLFFGGLLSAIVGVGTMIGSLPGAMSGNPLAMLSFEVGLSMTMYGGFLMGAAFDSQIYADMDNIGWNPFNTDESATDKSEKVSFYKGVPVIRVSGFGGSMSLGIIFLYKEHHENVLQHERGHIGQLMMMGILNYLIRIGIPSINKNDNNTPWELSASMLGGSSLADGYSDEQKNAAMAYFALASIPLSTATILTIIWFLRY